MVKTIGNKSTEPSVKNKKNTIFDSEQVYVII